MTEAKTDKNTTDALITNQEETIAMITEEEAKILINNSIENYKQRKFNIHEETNMVVENNISSTENTALLSVSYIVKGYKTDSKKANEQITTAIKQRYDQQALPGDQPGLSLPTGHADNQTIQLSHKNTDAGHESSFRHHLCARWKKVDAGD